MTYSGDSAIVGIGQATAAQIDDLFRQVATERNQRVTLPPPGLGQAFITGCRQYSQRVNHDLAAAQSAHETGGWTSFWASRNNPAGIGVTGQTGVGLSFPTVEAGIQAQVAHLLSYAAGIGEWTKDDPRASAMPRAWLGSAPTLHGLNGKWAVPGPIYGESIATLANRMPGGQPVAGDDPRYQWLPSGNYGYPNRGDQGRMGQTVDLLILHTTEGAYDGSLSWLRRDPHPPDVGSSTHYLMSADGSKRAQLVAESNAAWTAGNGAYNRRGVNVEMEGYANKGGFSDALYAEAATLGAAIIRRNPGILVDRQHIIGHFEVPPPNDHTDPGPHWDWPRFVAAIQRELGPAPIPPQPDEGKLVIPGTVGDYGFVEGFRAWVETLGTARNPGDVNAGILSITGYPLQDEWVGTDQLTYQKCERLVLQWNGANQPPWDIVCLPCRVVLPDPA